MSESGAVGADAHAAVARDVARMCAGGRPEGIEELSDTAALLVACGMVDPALRDVVVTRVHRGLPLPGPGGFHTLRVLELERHQARTVLADRLPQVVRLAVRSRLAELDRRHGTQRSVFVRGAGVFATRVKDIRAARRQGLYLDAVQRGQLFDALSATPTLLPSPVVPRTVTELGVMAAARGQREMARIPVSPRMRSMIEALPEPPEVRRDEAGITEMYTALLMEAGACYDRLQRHYRQAGAELDEIRLQFDAENELVGIAVDICGLRAAVLQSGRRPRHRGLEPGTGLGADMDRIWAEICERTVALRELVDSVEARMTEIRDRRRRLDEIASAQGSPMSGRGRGSAAVEDATDRLMARSGDRQLSTESMRRLRGRFGPGD